MKETRLQKTYRYYNRKYFGNSLPNPPNVKVKWGEIEPAMGLQLDNEIVINRCHRSNQRVWRGTLLHEIVHLKLDDCAIKSDHGKEFQAEMLRLAKLGAFRLIW
jgi:Zn-dependent peptidase ImmA (M78 family)